MNGSTLVCHAVLVGWLFMSPFIDVDWRLVAFAILAVAVFSWQLAREDRDAKEYKKLFDDVTKALRPSKEKAGGE